MPRIAFYTFAILKEKYGHPQVQGFVDKIEDVFQQARDSVGFIELDNIRWGTYVSPKFFNEELHAAAPATLSLWKDIESVCAFAYKKNHGGALKFREEWFIKPEWPTYVAWWIEDDKLPTREEACQRLEFIHDNGPTSYAFNFKKLFDENGKPVELDKQLLYQLVRSNEK